MSPDDAAGGQCLHRSGGVGTDDLTAAARTAGARREEADILEGLSLQLRLGVRPDLWHSPADLADAD